MPDGPILLPYPLDLISIFNIGYDENVFSTILPDGSISSPFTEIPGTVINTNISYIEQYEAWWDMIPDMRRIVIVGETGDVPRPFSSLMHSIVSSQ